MISQEQAKKRLKELEQEEILAKSLRLNKQVIHCGRRVKPKPSLDKYDGTRSD